MIELLTACGLGALTILHPCPLATNTATLGLLLALHRTTARPLLAVLIFMAAEILTFIVLAILIAASALKVAPVAVFLQTYIRQLTGPVLILSGMILTGLLQLGRSGRHAVIPVEKWISRYGHSGAFLLGMLAALSFCPFSAAMFFGVLIPLAVAQNMVITLPCFYGAGVALPLVLLAVILSKASVFLKDKSRIFLFAGKNQQKLLGSILIVSGIYFSLHLIYKIV